MDRGILNQVLLEGNIKYIEYYSLEENKILNAFKDRLNRLNINYISKNTSLFMDEIMEFDKNINLIYSKRVKYSTTLKAVINKYNGLSVSIENKFNGM